MTGITSRVSAVDVNIPPATAIPKGVRASRRRYSSSRDTASPIVTPGGTCDEMVAHLNINGWLQARHARVIRLAVDETFHPRICLLGIEPVSNFLLPHIPPAPRQLEDIR